MSPTTRSCSSRCSCRCSLPPLRPTCISLRSSSPSARLCTLWMYLFPLAPDSHSRSFFYFRLTRTAALPLPRRSRQRHSAIRCAREGPPSFAEKLPRGYPPAGTCRSAASTPNGQHSHSHSHGQSSILYCGADATDSGGTRAAFSA